MTARVSNPPTHNRDVRRVLIIDDSPDDCAEIRRLLLRGTEHQFRFSEASTGEDGVRAVLRDDGERPHCVVLDYYLPDMDALDVLRSLLGPAGVTLCPIVVLTGGRTNDLGRQVIRSGAQDFVGKASMTSDTLSRAIENAIERHAMAAELEKRDAALRESEQRYRLATAVGGLAVGEVDYGTNLIHLSPEAAVLFGLPERPVSVHRDIIHALCHPDDRAQLDRLIARSRDPNGDGTFALEHRIVHPDGRVRWHSVRKQVFFEDARPTRALLAMSDITARRDAEERLRRNQRTFLQLVENNPFGVYVVDSDFRLRVLSLGAKRAFASVGPLLGRDFAEVLRAIWPQPFAADVERRFRQTLETGEPYIQPNAVELRRDVDQHEAYDWRIERVVLPDDSKGVVCYFYDLTERKALEEALLQKERELRSLADNSPDVLTRFDRDLRHVFVNAAIQQAVGRDPADFIGKTNREVGLPEALCEELDLAIRSVLDSGQSTAVNFALPSPEGTRQFAARLVPEFGADGRVDHVLGVTHDVTARVNADASIRTSEARLQLALSAARAGAWTWDSRTGDIAWSKEMYALYGYHPSDAPPTYALWLSNVHPEDRDQLVAEMQEALDTSDREFRFEFRVQHPVDGIRWLLGVGRVDAAPDGTPSRMVGINLDISERKQFEETLAVADRRKDEFLATLAHELRNPLAPIRTGLSALEFVTSPAGAERLREMMKRQIGHLVHLVDDLLDVSRVRNDKITLRWEWITARDAVELAVETCRPSLDNARHRLVLELPDHEILIPGDRTRIVQVLANLITNAAKYTNAEGLIRISVATEPECVVFCVIDNGEGIAVDMLPVVWDLFTQARDTLGKAQGGLGIGLSLVKKLVEIHGGTVFAESAGLGHGSLFGVRLPLVEIASSHFAPASASTPAGRSGPPAAKPAGQRILIVDDNVDGAESLAILLGMSGYVTRTIHSGTSALHEAQAFRPDIILLDIGLPGIDGYEVARLLRADAITARTVIVAVTGWGSEEDRRKSRDAGFDWHLTKPMEVTALRDVLVTLLAARAHR